jgi:hypothetical protein
MKTQKIISAKLVTTAMLVVILLTIASCGSGQEKSVRENEQSSVSETKVKPPGMDLHAATFMGNLEAIQQHIKAGSNLNEKDEYGSSPLTIAATFGKTEVAKALIKAGADMNCKNNDGSTPLHTAAFFCRIEIVEALLKKGADKNLRNNYGSTALESISGPFDNVKGIYDQISKDLGPLGFKLDYEYVKETRPRIAEMLH